MDTLTNNLSERAMLATLNMSCWVPVRKDQKITNEVTERHAVEKDAGEWRKSLINRKAKSYAAVITAASALRTAHRANTLPWGDGDGARILTAQNFDRYSTIMRKLKVAFDEAVEEFVREFPSLKAEARAKLNGMFDERDYPTHIEDKFGARTAINPLPQAGDFRVHLSDDVVANIKSNITEELARTTQEAMREPYERLSEHIGRMVERLKDPKHVFRDSLVTGLAELCQILPALNLTGDTQLDELCAKAQSLITEPEVLRTNVGVRARVAQEAEDIQKQMAALMGGAS